MAGTQQRTNSSDAGNATDFSLRALRAHGVSDVQGANLKINQDEFFADLDAIIGINKNYEGCSVGKFINGLDEPIRKKLNEVIKNESVNSARLTEVLEKYGTTISSDVMRRHRRRMMGKDGCKCPRES